MTYWLFLCSYRAYWLITVCYYTSICRNKSGVYSSPAHHTPHTHTHTHTKHTFLLWSKGEETNVVLSLVITLGISEMESVFLDVPLASERCVQTDTYRATWPSFLYQPAAEGASSVLWSFAAEAAYETSFVCVKWYCYCTLPVQVAARS